MNVSVQLYGGGPLDGQTLTIDAQLHRTGAIRVPLPERPALAACDPAAVDPPPGYGALTFTWDGTINESGHARYRCST